ncbi:MAG TPA: M23 family metallopeptidase [Verrucomicrobiae bacterium]|nr:M23 family metallopeptidase [Verrucomicrobiae bacterium]
MLKKTLLRSSLSAIEKSLVCGLALACLTATPRLLVAEESTNKLVHVVTRQEGETTRFFVENLEPTEVTATFDLKLTNLKSSAGSSYTATYPPNQVTEAFRVDPINPDKQWAYNYINHFTIGSTSAVHDDSVVYFLPYESGTECKVTQGYNGSYSHSGADQYAIDWKMPSGTPIYAARRGMVVKVKVDSSTGGPDRKFENQANYILIRHSDGTVANYAHLSKGGSKVNPGDIVEPGDLIGYSGNTGFTSGPHLHFSVFKTKNGKQRQSIPVKFQSTSAQPITLVEGKTYKSVLPAKAVAKAHVTLPAVSVNPLPATKPVAPAAPSEPAAKNRDVKS